MGGFEAGSKEEAVTRVSTSHDRQRLLLLVLLGSLTFAAVGAALGLFLMLRRRGERMRRTGSRRRRSLSRSTNNWCETGAGALELPRAVYPTPMGPRARMDRTLHWLESGCTRSVE